MAYGEKGNTERFHMLELMMIADSFDKSTTRSQALFAEARAYTPGGVHSPVRAYRSVGGTPVLLARGKGSRVWDVDGHEYIDYIGSWGPLILGHAPEHVIRAVCETAVREALQEVAR